MLNGEISIDGWPVRLYSLPLPPTANEQANHTVVLPTEIDTVKPVVYLPGIDIRISNPMVRTTRIGRFIERERLSPVLTNIALSAQLEFARGRIKKHEGCATCPLRNIEVICEGVKRGNYSVLPSSESLGPNWYVLDTIFRFSGHNKVLESLLVPNCSLLPSRE